MSCPSTPDNLDDALEAALVKAVNNPLSVSISGHTVTQRSIDDLIKAAQFQRSGDGANVKGFGLRFQKIVLPGAWE